MAKQMQTTLRELRWAEACDESFNYLREALRADFGDDEPLPLTKILEINGLEDTVWALNCAVPQGKRVLRLWACDCAEHVLPIFEKAHPNDSRVGDCIKTTRKFLAGEETRDNLEVAMDAARNAAKVYHNSAYAAFYAARAACYPTSCAAEDAALRAANAACDYEAEQEWQKECLRKYLEDTSNGSEPGNGKETCHDTD